MKYRTYLAIGIAVIFCALAVYGLIRIIAEPEPLTRTEKIAIANALRIDPIQPYPVEAVLDGDTFIIKIGKRSATVRMLGIDTPETVDPRKPVQCYGKEASDQTKRLLTNAAVVLEMDPVAGQSDGYGRLLAYVKRSDGLQVNEFLLDNGYAREYTFDADDPYVRQKGFRAAESAARKEKAGLWGACL